MQAFFFSSICQNAKRNRMGWAKCAAAQGTASSRSSTHRFSVTNSSQQSFLSCCKSGWEPKSEQQQQRSEREMKCKENALAPAPATLSTQSEMNKQHFLGISEWLYHHVSFLYPGFFWANIMQPHVVERPLGLTTENASSVSKTSVPVCSFGLSIKFR